MRKTPSRQQEGRNSASEPIAEWLRMTHVRGLAPFRRIRTKGILLWANHGTNGYSSSITMKKNPPDLALILQREGYDSIATWSGLEALELLKSGEYDILLVSSYLPDVYVGDFFQRLNRLPVQPCSIVMQEGQVSCRYFTENEERDRRGKITDKVKAAVVRPDNLLGEAARSLRTKAAILTSPDNISKHPSGWGRSTTVSRSRAGSSAGTRLWGVPHRSAYRGR